MLYRDHENPKALLTLAAERIMDDCNNVEKISKKSYSRFQYTQSDLISAVSSIINKEKSLNEVHRETGIPKSTLSNKINNKVPMNRKMGPPTVLSDSEENRITKWILAKARVGFPIHPETLKDSIQKILKESNKPNPFTNDRPGVKWLGLFLKRHPNIAKRNTELISKSRAAVTERSIRYWFADVLLYLTEQDSLEILKDGRRVINCDETGLQLCPKSGKVLGPKSMPNFYEIAKSGEKENITVLCTYSADGSSLPPLIIYPYKRIPSHISQTVPDTWGIGRSDSGWMVAATFFEYIANVLYPWLINQKVDFPVIIYLDGHKSHLSLELAEFCSEKNIHLYCLPPNATHILQPCDVSIFKPLKSYWKDVTKEHNLNSNSPITKNNFGILLQKAFEKVKPESIVNGFRACGLFPLNPDAVDYQKCISTRQAEISREETLETSTTPNNEDYLSCQKVINYVLKDYNLEDIISKELYFAKVWNASKLCVDNMNTEMLIPCNSFDISQLPVEIDTNFSFNKDELDSLGVGFLNTELINNEHFHATTSNENLVFENNLLHIETDTDTQFQRLTQISITPEILPGAEMLTETNNELEKLFTPVNSQDIFNKIDTQHSISMENLDLENNLLCFESDTDIQLQNLTTIINTPSNVQEIFNQTNKIRYEYQEPSTSTNVVSQSQTDSSPNSLWNKHFSWPKENKINPNLKKRRPIVPYAITSKIWKDIQVEKENLKKEKESLIEKKRNARILKKIEIENIKKLKKKKVVVKNKKTDSSINDTSSEEDSSFSNVEIESANQGANPLLCTDKFDIGNYVIVIYEDEYFPGVIKTCKTSEYQVKTMTMSGLNWKWPATDDICWYKKKCVIEKIASPKVLNKRNMFFIPEIAKYQKCF